MNRNRFQRKPFHMNRGHPGLETYSSSAQGIRLDITRLQKTIVTASILSDGGEIGRLLNIGDDLPKYPRTITDNADKSIAIKLGNQQSG